MNVADFATEEMLRTAGVPVTADAVFLFTRVWPIYEHSLRHFVKVITPDPDDQEDLMQEAMIALWECDASKFDYTSSSDIWYVRQVLVTRVWRVWGKQDHQSVIAPLDLAAAGLPLVEPGVVASEAAPLRLSA